MDKTRYKPLIDKLFWIIFSPTVCLIAAMTVVSSIEPFTLFIAIPIDLAVVYLLVSPLFGYVELRQDSVYIKYGFFLKKEIPYKKIRGVVKERKFYSDSMMSLKNAYEHVNIKYNTFDITTVSVVNNDAFITALNKALIHN